MSPPRKPKKPKQEQPEGITRITVKGFKSLAEETSIEIRPLTILAGANSSGKSSIMQPLLLLKQTLEATYDPGPLKIDGPNVCFSQVREMFPRLLGQNLPRELKVALQAGDGLAVTDVFRHGPGSGLELAETAYRDSGRTLRLRPAMPYAELARRVGQQMNRERTDLAKLFKRRLEWRVCAIRGFLTVGLAAAGARGAPPEPLVIRRLPEAVSQSVSESIHLPGLRGNPERTYKRTGTGPLFPGLFVEYPASIISEWGETEDGRLQDLAGDLLRLGLTWKVRARPLTDTDLEVHVGRLARPGRGGSRDLVNIADVGFGVSQVLPVLVALRAASPGRLVYIEEPEIHLHPRAQVALASILADAAKRGVRVVAETHSDLLLLGVQTLVAQRDLSPSDVKLHWFKRDDRGVTRVLSADLDKAGTFGEWPEDFADERLKAQAQYLDAAEPRRWVS